MAGGLGDADVARDGSVEGFVFEVFSDFGEDLGGEGSTFVVHGGEDAEELEVRVHGFADEFHGFEELGDTFKGVKFGLDGEEEVVGGDHAVDREEGEGRGRVDDDVIVVICDAGEGVFENSEFAFLVDKFDFGVSEVGGGGGEVEEFVFGRLDGAFEGDSSEHDFDHATFEFGFVQAEAGSGVALRVEVDEKGAESVLGEVIAKVDGSSSFADTSFLIRNADYDSHTKYYNIKRIQNRIFGLEFLVKNYFL